MAKIKILSDDTCEVEDEQGTPHLCNYSVTAFREYLNRSYGEPVIQVTPPEGYIVVTCIGGEVYLIKNRDPFTNHGFYSDDGTQVY